MEFLFVKKYLLLYVLKFLKAFYHTEYEFDEIRCINAWEVAARKIHIKSIATSPDDDIKINVTRTNLFLGLT